MTDTSKNQMFQSALEHVLRYEGGYVDHPRDPGGATKFGITRKTLAKFRQISPWWKLPKSAVRTLGRVETAKIYLQNYWHRVRADDLPEALAFAVFDYAVNSGPVRAVRSLQSLVGARTDGIVGPQTLKAVNKHCDAIGVHKFLEQYIKNRHDFLKRLGTYSVFGSGWRARIAQVRRHAHKLANKTSPKRGNQKLNILAGYKTYLVAAFMLISGLMEMLGINVPAVGAENALQLVMEALAVLFLRKGLKSEIANA